MKMSHPKKFSVTNLNAAKRKVFGSDTNQFFWAILQTVSEWSVLILKPMRVTSVSKKNMEIRIATVQYI